MRAIAISTRVCQLIEQHGGVRPTARLLGIDAGYFLRLKTGKKTHPGTRILKKLGLIKLIQYYLKVRP